MDDFIRNFHGFSVRILQLLITWNEKSTIIMSYEIKKPKSMVWTIRNILLKRYFKVFLFVNYIMKRYYLNINQMSLAIYEIFFFSTCKCQQKIIIMLWNKNRFDF